MLSDNSGSFEFGTYYQSNHQTQMKEDLRKIKGPWSLGTETHNIGSNISVQDALNCPSVYH